MAGGLFGGGSGTIADPYLVEDAADLNQVRFGLELHYKQVADIYFMYGDGYYNNWTPITPFTGSYIGELDEFGNRKVIANFTYNKTATIQNFALFGAVSGTIKNIELPNFSVITSGVDFCINQCAGICLGLSGGTVENCKVVGFILSNNSYVTVVGGIVSYSYLGTITLCETDMDIRANTYTQYCGGILAYQFYGSNTYVTNISKCSSIFKNTVNTYSESCGGIFGGTLTNVGTSSTPGDVNIKYCSSDVGIMNAYMCGGIAGSHRHRGSISIKNCYSKGKIEGLRSDNNTQTIYIGGIFGYNYPSKYSGGCYIEKCYSEVILKGWNYVAGIYGGPIASSNRQTVLRCFALMTDIHRYNGSTGVQFGRITAVGKGTYDDFNYNQALDTMEFHPAS